MAKKVSASDILRLLTLMGGAGMASSPSAMIMSGGIGGIGGNAGGIIAREDGSVTEYPKEFAPGHTHDYNVVYAPRTDKDKGYYQNMNYMGNANRDIIEQAAEQQTIDEHNRAITKFVSMLPPNATPRQVRDAIQRGRDEEKQLPKWWNESNNRREFSVSSSAVSGIRITPEGNVEVQWKNKPKWYTFRQYGNTHDASVAAKELLNSPSIGRAVYPVVFQGTGPRMSKDPRNPGMLGEWNQKNYDASYAH